MYQRLEKRRVRYGNEREETRKENVTDVSGPHVFHFWYARLKKYSQRVSLRRPGFFSSTILILNQAASLL
jgi:hypothetical protein